MRLSFGNGAHRDIVLSDGSLTLGSAAGNDVLLDGKDVSPWHARIIADARGLVLQVLDPNAKTHVNARPVREMALLRRGDVVHLGHEAVAIKADSDALDTRLPAAGTAVSAAVPRVTLRGLSGASAGRAIGVEQRLLIGSDPAADVVIDDVRVAPRHAVIERMGDGLWLRSLAPGQGALVNGVVALDARLQAGDQVVFARQHFLIEAPGLAAAAAPMQTPAAAAPAPVEDSTAQARDGNSIGWLLAAAALIALALYVLINRGL
ncbi:MAG: FHA domain-containing protein [Dokdonella sp.]|uniref:FHA domain-containing protein n=1 Tax=Dokdonella sp. TaxID=2291710 RepID=UPI0025C02003|nr:FHA domain-containing protein [Dokdonella sp.]MBX3701568.1 FHA domain-containing protein [Dokdonella sp.]